VDPQVGSKEHHAEREISGNGESTNCHLIGNNEVRHIYLTDSPAQQISSSIIVATTPRTLLEIQLNCFSLLRALLQRFHCVLLRISLAAFFAIDFATFFLFSSRRDCEAWANMAGSLLAARRGNSRFQNGSGGGKDVRCVVVGDFFFGFQPVLDVAPAELCPVESQRFATDERDRFRFHLAQMAGSVFAVHELFGTGMPENHMGDFVERGFVRERG